MDAKWNLVVGALLAGAVAAGCGGGGTPPLPTCEVGTPGCGCSESGSCDTGLVCIAEVCQSPTCAADGADGCPCAADDICDAGLTCNSVGYCESAAGQGGGSCYSNRTCDAGFTCTTEGMCESCEQGTRGCDCFGNQTCAGDLSCESGICTSGTNVVIPESPRCFSPCRTGFTDADGVYRSCSVEGLMEGCVDGRTCVEGACVGDGEAPPTCDADAECPDFQVCIGGQCYSNCEYDSDCGGMARCHMHACRAPCSASNDACSDGTYCELQDSDFGYCMPTAEPAATPPQEMVDGTFSVGDDVLTTSNLVPTRQLRLSHDAPRSIDFIIRKVSHTTFTDTEPVTESTAPMPWLAIGAVGTSQSVMEYSVRVPPGETVLVEVKNLPSGAPSQYRGVLRVSSELGGRDVNIEYARGVDGRWAGRAYYFTQFNDAGVDAWLAGGAASAVPNALVQRWANLRAGTLTTFEFQTILTSIVTESWRSVSPCGGLNNDSTAACYPSVNSNGAAEGLGILASDVGDAVPSGIVELPFAVDLQLATGNQYTGRIVSEVSLQYAADPRFDVTFGSDVTQCAPGTAGAACLAFVDSLDATVTVGGRYATTVSDTACAAGGSSFVHTAIPWLIPGFESGTDLDPQTQVRYRYECRDSAFPAGGANPVQRNTGLARANPIPDGRSRIRRLELLDGVMANQDYLYLLVREVFEADFLGVNTEEFGAYGVIVLERSNVPLSARNFTANDHNDTRTFSVDLGANVACDDALHYVASAPALDVSTVDVVANLMLNGAAAPPSGGELASGNSYLCHDTGRFGPGSGADGEAVICPAGSNVTFFNCVSGACNVDLMALSCQRYDQASGNCGDVLRAWEFDSTTTVIRDPVYTCAVGSYCDDDRANLLSGKTFYEPGVAGAPTFLPIRAAIDQAFRYKTQFQNREGRNIGFSPEICPPGAGDTVPYCYDPLLIEELRARHDCLAHIASTDSLFSALPTATQDDLTGYLRVAFADEAIPSTLPVDPRVAGFEQATAELLVMLGDEQFTSAFQSRFDLAGQARVSFEGSLLEPGGINLSGVAGFEMYTLYQSAQYYQMVLDRFYSLLPHVWAALEATDGRRNFVTQETITTYLDRVLRASTQRARAFSEIARRYQRFDRSDLAETVVQRAYTSAYLESVVIGRLVESIAADADPADRPQLVAELERAATIYKIALLDMREIFSNLGDGVNIYGFANDYIPMPALDPNGPPAIEVLIARARQAAATAAQREDIAINSNRQYETDAAAFQSELSGIRNTYENQLADLCGTFEGRDGVIYPAIRRYAQLSDRAAVLQDPCGLMGNGAIHRARTDIDVAGIEAQRVVTAFRINQEQISIEEGRLAAQCSAIRSLADLQISADNDIQNFQTKIRRTQLAIDIVDRIAQATRTSLRFAECEPPVAGTAASPGNCAQVGAAIGGAIKAEALGITTASAQARARTILEDQIQDVRVELMGAQADAQCDQLRIDGLARIEQLGLELVTLELDALRVEYQGRLALSEAGRLRNQATRVEAEQAEAEQLAINVQAARNDPNVRIYKNDAIINADASFQVALREAYRATKMFEYHTSQSYARLDELSLVRLVSRGDFNLENYLADLEEAYFVFLEDVGRPDSRVDILSLRDDILQIPDYGDDGGTLTLADRVERFRVAITDPQWLNPQGHLAIPFSTATTRLSPLTRNHKLRHVEIEFIGSDVGDQVGRAYLAVAGTGMLSAISGDNQFFRFPERTAVVNTFFNGVRAFTPDIYQNQRLRERPYVNTNWEFSFNQRDEFVNQDVDLSQLTDVRIYLYLHRLHRPLSSEHHRETTDLYLPRLHSCGWLWWNRRLPRCGWRHGHVRRCWRPSRHGMPVGAASGGERVRSDPWLREPRLRLSEPHVC